ncbi:neurexin 1 isoform X3 [Cloeon dipterum]|uniref:neurexin 1 isoform X3 n=1 Tax=Cloeon dipterum TaxID=197152 RepID=UPI00321F9A53
MAAARSTLVYLLAVLSYSCIRCFVLEGSQSSYAQFHKWNAGLNGSLEFEFKTEIPNGLLLYTDDGGTYDFFEIKLVEGALRLRYNLGGGAQMLTVGRDLHDGHWHKVHVRRRHERTSLTVDQVTQSKTSRGKEFHFGNLATNSDVFIGGMPSWYNTRLTLLALPSVIFEPRFGGSIRNLVYASEDGVPRRQEMKMKDFKGVRGNSSDACEDHDPCQHGGICISTDSGPICECRNLDYEGAYCEKDKAPAEATFRGKEFLSYDLSKTGAEPIVSTQDSISLSFKTRQPNGLLFYTGDGTDYLNLALRDGGVVLTMSLGNGKLEFQIKPHRVRFDDNQWHKVTVHRKVQEIAEVTSFCRLSAVVDGVYAEHANTAGTFGVLSSSRVYVGGSENTHALPGSKIHNNFIGCLRKVEFSADTLRLNMIDLGRTGSKLLTMAGSLDFMCQEVEAADPVTFTTKDSHLLEEEEEATPVPDDERVITFFTEHSYVVLPSWDAPRTGSISFKIRTNEPNGLLMYSAGTTSAHADFFAFEVLAGHVYLHLDLGSGTTRVQASPRRIDDGGWHEITLRRNGREGRVTVDGSAADFKTPGESNQLDLEGALYVGGLGPLNRVVSVPPSIWSAALRHGYVGCLRDLVINGNAVDVAGYARRQDSGAIRPSCRSQPKQCESKPCMNGGQCAEGWNRFVCDCSSTSFTGPRCAKDAATLSFNGTQFLLASYPEEMRTQAEEISLRFMTSRPLGLLLLTAGSTHASDRLELTLSGGRVRLAVRLADREKVLQAGQSLNNNQWHTVRYSRKGTLLKLQVDDEPPASAETLSRQITLEFRRLHVGSIATGQGDEVSTSSFVGQMQQLYFNNQQFFEQARTGHHHGGPASIKVTAKFGKREQIVHHPATFKSKHAFVGLPMLKAYSSTNIYFQFKTQEPNGLILFNAGKEQDFIAIELVHGHIHYIFNLGDGPVRVRDSGRSALNDNKWHAVTIGRPTSRQHTLLVDDNFSIVTGLGLNENLDLAGILYIGGVRKDMFSQLPKQIQSRHGYEGCLASLDLNGESPNLVVDAEIPSTMVVAGCETTSTKCSHNVCANRGMCMQQWNSQTCDCDLTSFTGPTCSEESIAFEFGPGSGMITFTFPEDHRPDMRSDVLAMGFITTKEDAVLFRVDSGSSNDYMELEIVEGNVFMVYNMGTNDHPIGEVGVKVNDNQYHVVRFTRSGANSTLQIDDYSVQTLNPGGNQLGVFNSPSQIQIGGKWHRSKHRMERPFVGVMAGLVFNEIRILDLAADKDSRITIKNEVQPIPSLPAHIKEKPMIPNVEMLHGMQRAPASSFPGVMDDLIFSGAGSGCNADDEDECTPIFDTGSGDDLITPVYVPPTRPPPTKVFGKKIKSDKPCDDEDCFPGSGFGPVTEDTIISSSRGPTTGISMPESSSPHFGQTYGGSSGGSPGSTGVHQVTSIITSEIPFSPDLVDQTSSSSGGSSSSSSFPSSSVGTSSTSSSSSPSSTFSSSSTSSSTSTTSTTEAPPPPPPPPPHPHPTPSKPRLTPKDRERISSEAAEYTALVIGVIAATMIIIILVILIILKFKGRADASYKVDESKNYHQGYGAQAALLNGSQANGMHNEKGGYGVGMPPLNPAVGPVKVVKKQNNKDVKEWYV